MSHVISPRLVCVHVYLYLDQGHMPTWVWSQDRVVLYTAIFMDIHFVNEVWIPYGVKFSQFLQLKNHPTIESQQKHTNEYKHTCTHTHIHTHTGMLTHRYVLYAHTVCTLYIHICTQYTHKHPMGSSAIQDSEKTLKHFVHVCTYLTKHSQFHHHSDLHYSWSQSWLW